MSRPVAVSKSLDQTEPSSGYIEGKTHYFPARVYWAETDSGGVVYHASYLNFAERGRVELLRLLGLGQDGLRRDHGLIFAVRHCEIDYKVPARLDDALLIETKIAQLGGASMELHQSIQRAGDRKEFVLLKVTLVAITLEAKAMRIPDVVREKFNTILSS
jgi:acyl-CoA thioester hydrolase